MHVQASPKKASRAEVRKNHALKKSKISSRTGSHGGPNPRRNTEGDRRKRRRDLGRAKKNNQEKVQNLPPGKLREKGTQPIRRKRAGSQGKKSFSFARTPQETDPELRKHWIRREEKMGGTLRKNQNKVS